MQNMKTNIVVITLTMTTRIDFFRDKRWFIIETIRFRFGHIIIIGASLDMDKDRAYRENAVKNLVDFCKENEMRKYVDLEIMGWVHISSVSVAV